eukprot:6972621-Prymnesium_polylepis.1
MIRAVLFSALSPRTGDRVLAFPFASSDVGGDQGLVRRCASTEMPLRSSLAGVQRDCVRCRLVD